MEILNGAAIILVIAACVLSGYRSRLPYQILGGQAVSVLLASFIPIIIFSAYFSNQSIGLEEAKVFGREHWLTLVIVAVIVEELLKLGALLFFGHFAGVPIDFATRAWIGITFGLWELAAKAFTLRGGQLLTLDIFAVASSAIGLHSLTVLYPNTLSLNRVLPVFLIMVVYHVIHNSLILKVIPSFSASEIDLSQMFVLFVPWIIYGAVLIVVSRGGTAMPKVWQ